MALTRITKGVIKPNENYDTHNINSTGIVTAIGLDINGNGDISGNLSVGGVLTYEDVTSIDSVGIITAQKDIHVGAGVSVVGIVTAATFKGDGDFVDIDVDGHTNLDNVSIAGVTTCGRIDTGTINVSAHYDIRFASGNWSGNTTKIQNHNNYLYIVAPSNGFQFRIGATDLWLMDSISNDGNFWPTVDSARDIGKSNRRIRNLYATTLYGNGDFVELDVDGHTNLDNVSIAGVSTFAGTVNTASIVATGIDLNGDLDVDGHTNLDNVSIAGIVTATEYRGGGSTGIKVTSAGKVLIGTSTQGSTSADELTIEGSGIMGLSLRSDSTTGESNVLFADGTSGADRYTGGIQYQHQHDRFRINVNGGQLAVQINKDKSLNTYAGLSVSGIATATGADINGDLDVDGHTNLDNVSVAGVSTNASTTYFDNQVYWRNGGSNKMFTLSNNGGMNWQDNVKAEFGNSGDLKIYNVSSENHIHGSTSQPIIFSTNNDERLRITSAGLVGIGTVSPSSDVTLTVHRDVAAASGNATMQINNLYQGTANQSNASGAEIEFKFKNHNASHNWWGGRILCYNSDNYNQYSYLRFDTASQGNAVERMRLAHDGDLTLFGKDNAELKLKCGSATSNNILAFINSGGTTKGRILYDSDNNFMAFSTNGTASSDERVRITSTGRIEIGSGSGVFASAPVEVKSTSSSGWGAYPEHISLVDQKAYNSTDNGGGIVFGGKYNNAGQVTTFAGIHCKKSNTTDGDYGGILTFNTREHANSNFERMRIDSYGRIFINSVASTVPTSATPRSLNIVAHAHSEAAITFSRSSSTMGSGSTAGKSIILLSDGALSFQTHNVGERLRITQSGVIEAKTLAGSYYPIASARDGSTSARAATSAWEIKKTLGPRAKTGYYYLINPYDSSVNTWWCDMTTDGGGWILVAHVGDGGMSSQSTADGNHWWNRSNKGGFDTVGSGYYKGGGYWRTSGGAWAENTCGQLMWDVRTQDSQYDNYSNAKVVFNWGTDQALPTGGSNYTNIPNAGNRRFNEWCYEVVGAPGFNPSNYHQNQRSNIISGGNYFTEHMVMTWCFRGTSGAADAGDSGPYWMIGSHHDGLHQHYEESLSGSDGVYGDGGYYVVSNEDTGWGGGGSNGGYSRIGRHTNTGVCNVWLR